MEDFDIIKLVSDALDPLNVLVIEGWYDDELSKTHITVHEYLDQEDGFEDDEASEIIHNIQVDIWSEDSLESYNLKKNAKKLLKNNGFSYSDGQDFFEKDTKIYHKAMRLTYVEYI